MQLISFKSLLKQVVFALSITILFQLMFTISFTHQKTLSSYTHHDANSDLAVNQEPRVTIVTILS